MTDPYAFRVQSMRIIHGALCLGVIVFAAVALVMYPEPRQLDLENNVPVVSLVCLVMSLPQVLLALFGFGIFEKAWRAEAARQPRPSDPWSGPSPEVTMAWWTRAQTRLVIRSALIESSAFMNLVAYMVEQQGLSLIAGMVYLAVLGLMYPTRQSVEAWIAQQSDLARQRMG